MRNECQVEGCTSQVRCVSLCALHYDRRRRQGEDFDRSVGTKTIPRKNKKCLRCSREVSRQGLCWKHYEVRFQTPCIGCGRLSTKNRKRCLDCYNNLTSPKGEPKLCSYCKKERDESQFGARYDSARRKKLRSRCRDCETNVRTKVKVTDIVERYGYVCYLCEEEIDLSAPRKIGTPGWERGFHREHVVPLSRGGTNTLDNCRPAHGRCNVSKGTSL